MIKNGSVNKADIIKMLRIEGYKCPPAVAGKTIGDMPRPIRKKGFWRAFKRKEIIAIISFSLKQVFDEFIPYFKNIEYSHYCLHNHIYLMWPIK